MLRVVALLALASILAGCAAMEPPAPRQLSGPTDGYTPTSVFLKLHVKRDDGTTALLDFDRKDWYTAEIARRVEHHKLDFVSAQAQPRDILNEYLAQEVASPEDLDSLRYDAMGATGEERSLMDAEYEELLQKLAVAPPSVVATETGGLVPANTL